MANSLIALPLYVSRGSARGRGWAIDRGMSRREVQRHTEMADHDPLICPRVAGILRGACVQIGRSCNGCFFAAAACTSPLSVVAIGASPAHRAPLLLPSCLHNA